MKTYSAPWQKLLTTSVENGMKTIECSSIDGKKHFDESRNMEWCSPDQYKGFLLVNAMALSEQDIKGTSEFHQRKYRHRRM